MLFYGENFYLSNIFLEITFVKQLLKYCNDVNQKCKNNLNHY